MINSTEVLTYLERETDFRAQDILILLGPTASGKTKLAVQLAKSLDAEIISADSRQVYRKMNIGTGKDLNEYEYIPYHLIDIVNPGEQYNVSRFLEDFERAFRFIKDRGKKVIVCGGTGFYLHALLSPQPFNKVPTDMDWRRQMETKPKEELEVLLDQHIVPEHFEIDRSSKKRMVRALEILTWLSLPENRIPENAPTYAATVIGINPELEYRRQAINARLEQRLEEGMVDEVNRLLQDGLTFEELEYYGLEYKYIAYYLQGKLDYKQFVTKLQTKIHSYAKRQMTFFRKLEKDGIKIHWFNKPYLYKTKE